MPTFLLDAEKPDLHKGISLQTPVSEVFKELSSKNSETAPTVYILIGNLITDLWTRVDIYFIPPLLKVFLGSMMHEHSIPTCNIKMHFNPLQSETIIL